MRSVSEDVLLSATATGELSLQVAADLVSIKTFYKSLQSLNEGKEDSKEEAPAAQCRMNIKKFSKILNTRIVNVSQYVLGCVVEGHAFVLYAEIGQNLGHATFYIPILTM
uniref:Checkpoint protein n=1 Tax=Lotharella globosa TaxID=91324 RepID=A0A7S3ZEN1_9EUKA|mmetsp:Transcript_4099/g.7495  ORF Transcript_4099/g.7495 Transcript_4099/m.7495 type:complete len:110 (+) Transcript_4099:2-331(+)